MQFHRVKRSDTATQSTISANVPGHKEWTRGMQEKKTNNNQCHLMMMQRPLIFTFADTGFLTRGLLNEFELCITMSTFKLRLLST